MCNTKGKLIYKADLIRKEFKLYFKVYQDTDHNLSYDLQNSVYCIVSLDTLHGDDDRLPDVKFEILNSQQNIKEQTQKYFDDFIEKGSFNIVKSISF